MRIMITYHMFKVNILVFKNNVIHIMKYILDIYMHIVVNKTIVMLLNY